MGDLDEPDRAGGGTPSAGQDPRERILSAAEALFAEQGFDATGTARIADVAGIPKGLLFYYFPRKIDILLTLLDERMPALPLFEAADVALPGDPNGSLLRIADRLEVGEHDSVVLRIIIHREDSTHRMVRDRVLALREHRTRARDLRSPATARCAAPACRPDVRRPHVRPRERAPAGPARL
jgi:AcrR family transcriptional regulator